MQAKYFGPAEVITNGIRVGLVRRNDDTGHLEVHFTHDEPRVVSTVMLAGNDWVRLSPLPTLQAKIHNELQHIRSGKNLEAVERDILALPEIADLITEGH